MSVSDSIEKLKGQLDQFERLRESIDATRKSASRLMPAMKEEKENLQEKMREKRERIEQIDETILKLEREKAGLHDELQSAEERISNMNNQIKLILHLG